eukprot:768736-Hanusia_phi.AAC.4
MPGTGKTYGQSKPLRLRGSPWEAPVEMRVQNFLTSLHSERQQEEEVLRSHCGAERHNKRSCMVQSPSPASADHRGQSYEADASKRSLNSQATIIPDSGSSITPSATGPGNGAQADTNTIQWEAYPEDSIAHGSAR